MRTVPQRPTVLTFLVLIGTFVAGPLLGLRLGAGFAPDSEVAQMASVFAFALAFLAGHCFWFGFALLTIVPGALRSLLRGRLPRAPADLTGSRVLVPPGYRSFVVFSVLASGAAGLCVGLFSEASFVSMLAAYGACGGLCGLTLSVLAHHGYLPFPEPA